METLKIEILNPKAKNILKGLADLNLIKIKKEPEEKDFSALLKKMRKQYDTTPDLNEIAEEVEQVRKIRNEK
jgi:hypothetical protein